MSIKLSSSAFVVLTLACPTVFAQSEGSIQVLMNVFKADEVRSLVSEFQKISELEQSKLIVPITPTTSTKSLKSYCYSMGDVGMGALAASLGCAITQIKGAHVMRKVTSQFEYDRNELGRWLAGISSEQVSAMIGEGLSLASLQPGKANAAIEMTGTSSSNSMYYIQGNLETARVFMTPILAISYSKNGKFTEVQFGNRTEYPHDEKAASFPAEKAPKQQFPKPVPGDLNFGRGDIYSIGHLAKLAYGKFGKFYRFDERFANNVYFISGSYSEAEFQEIFDYLVDLKPQPELPRIQIEDLLLKLMPGWSALLKNQWTSDAIRNGISVNSNFLMTLGEDWQVFLKERSIPASTEVKIRPLIHFVISVEKFLPPPEGVRSASVGAYRLMTSFRLD